MEKTKTFILAILVMAGTVTAGDNVFEKAKTGYLTALNSDNPGLRHSAIYQVAQLKCLFPEKDFSDVERFLKRTGKKDHVAIIRVHAGLVAAFLDTSNVKRIHLSATENPIEFFEALHKEFSNEFIESAALPQVTSL